MRSRRVSVRSCAEACGLWRCGIAGSCAGRGGGVGYVSEVSTYLMAKCALVLACARCECGVCDVVWCCRCTAAVVLS